LIIGEFFDIIEYKFNLTTFQGYLMSTENYSISIAQTIISQIKSTDFWALGSWGAKNYVSLPEGRRDFGYVLGGLQFDVSGRKIQRGGKVIVYLMGNDTYTVRVIKVFGSKITEVKTVQEVYCDGLMETIDNIIER
jgi:hypothetical protein